MTIALLLVAFQRWFDPTLSGEEAPISREFQHTAIAKGNSETRYLSWPVNNEHSTRLIYAIDKFHLRRYLDMYPQDPPPRSTNLN